MILFPHNASHTLSVILVFPHDYPILHIDDSVFPDLLRNLYSNYTIKLVNNSTATLDYMR